MLHLLRRAVKSLPAKILLGLLIASFAVWGIGDIFTHRSQGDVATVGDTSVSAERLADALTRTQRRLTQERRQFVSMDQLRQSGIARATLAGLIRDASFEEELHRLGIRVPASAVRDSIVQNPTFQDGQGQFSQYLYKSRLGQAGFDPSTFEAATRQLLGQQLLVDAVSPAVVAPPGTGKLIAAHNGEKRTLSFVRLTPDMAPDPGTPTESQLASYFSAHSDQFMEPERRSGVYLHTDLDKLARENAPSDQEIRAEYEAHPDQYTAKPTRDVEQIVFKDMDAANAAASRIRSGEATFAEIAAEQNVSMADLSLGTVTEQDLPDASAKAVFAQTEPGLVGPVQGTFGPILYNVTAVQNGGTQPLDKVAGKISSEIAQNRAVEAAVKKANKIDDLRASGTPLPEIAKKTGVDLVHFDGLDASGHAADGDAPPLAALPAFMDEVNAASEGEERDMSRLPDGSYVLVMVQKVVPRHLPELSDIHDKVAAAWAREQRMQALEARAKELAGQVTPENGLAAVAAAENLAEPQEISFTRGTEPPMLTPEMASEVFASEPGEPVTGRTAQDDMVLLGVVESVTPLPEDELAKNAEAVDKALLSSIAQDQVEYYARAVEREQGVEVDKGAVEQVFARVGR